MLAIAVAAGPAAAHQDSHHAKKHHPTPATVVASQLISPLKVAFGPKGSYLVTESFAGKLTNISAKGVKTTVVSAPGQEIGGVSYRNGTTYYFNNDQGTGPEPGAELLPARLMSIDHRGKTRQIADLSVFEGAHNPDGKTVYGVRDAAPACLAQAPNLRSTGEVFSHPYASAPANGGVYVADAGANSILHVSEKGKVKLVKVLPAEPITIDAQVVAMGAEMGMDIPNCMLGHKYYAQAVPTDITLSGQWLYYTVLPGAPGESLGAGKAYRMNMHSGRTQLLAQGLAAPTGIAVDGKNKVYVAQLFGDGVSVLKNGRASTVLRAAMAADVAVSGSTLAAVTGALDEVNGGSLVTMRLK
ncbi:hypothetical protein B5P43_34400 [Bacillus sp. SRB_336]|nr:hypothetical protein B5P43_34400 [Bacillus sp. SRB_336]